MMMRLTFIVVAVAMKVLIAISWAGSHQLPVGPSQKGFRSHQGETNIEILHRPDQ